MSTRLREIARETVAVTEAGRYRAGGTEVVIGPDVARAVEGTRLYRPDDPLPTPRPAGSAEAGTWPAAARCTPACWPPATSTPTTGPGRSSRTATG